MIYSQINITNIDHKFTYAVEYVDNDIFARTQMFSYNIYKNSINFIYNGEDIDVLGNLHTDVNCWHLVSEGTQDQYIPEQVNISSLNMYFPRYAVDTYEKHPLYSLDIYTYIYGQKVVLGNYLVDRMSAIACDHNVKFKNIEYPEYISVPFIDPWYITYSDEWADFRANICGEPTGINNTGSLLYVELTPVQYSNDSHCYIIMDNYNGGFNCMTLSSSRDDYMTNLIHLEESDSTICIVSDVLFNEAYEGDFDTYLQETYHLDTSMLHTVFELVVKDEDNLYSYKAYQYDSIVPTHVFNKSDVDFNDWTEFREGLMLTGSVIIEDENLNAVLTILSNNIPMTQDVYSYIVHKDETIPGYINLDEVNMNNYNINAVNKIKKEVVNVQRPDDYKANLIKPIFVKVNPADNINIHPNVNENIAINLDAYKNYTDVMYIQLEGIIFPEVARTIYGVVFSITGSALPCEELNGKYYILDEDKQMITSGNYTYIV